MNDKPEDRILDPNDGEAAIDAAREFLEREYTVSGDTPTASTTPTIETTDLPDNATQVVTVGELKELLDYAFRQGLMRGFAEALEAVEAKITEDPEITEDIKEYLNTLLGGL
jgi:hypothetical protein